MSRKAELKSARRHSRSIRELVAILVSPLVGSWVTMLGTTVFSTGTDGAWQEPLQLIVVSAVYATMFGALFGWPIAITLGWYTHQRLQQLNRGSLLSYLGASIALGAAATIIIFIALLPFQLTAVSPLALLSRSALLTLPATSAGTIVFWLIVRPDRDVAKP